MEQLTALRPMAFKVVLYEAIRRTAEAQQAALHADDLGTFFDLLVEREKLLDRVDGVDTKNSSADNSELDRRDRSAAKALVRDILIIDQQTEHLLNQKIGATKDELQTVQAGRTALNGYQYLAPAVAPTYFFDRMS